VTVKDAVKAAVQAAVPEVKVYVGAVLDDQGNPEQPPSRYVVVYSDNGLREATSYQGRLDGRWSWTVNFYAGTDDEASWMADTVREYLTSHRIIVDGWRSQKPRHDYSGQQTFDDDVLSHTIVQCTEQFSMHAFQTA
jgi:hypothetical protein